MYEVYVKSVPGLFERAEISVNIIPVVNAENSVFVSTYFPFSLLPESSVPNSHIFHISRHASAINIKPCLPD